MSRTPQIIRFYRTPTRDLYEEVQQYYEDAPISDIWLPEDAEYLSAGEEEYVDLLDNSNFLTIVPDDDPMVVGSKEDIITQGLDEAPFDFTEWLAYNESLPAEDIQTGDGLVPASFDISLTDDINAQLMSGTKATYIYTADLQTAEDIILLARDVFPSNYQNKIDSIYTFIIKHEAFQNLMEGEALYLEESFGLNSVQYNEVRQRYNSFIGVNFGVNNVVAVDFDYSQKEEFGAAATLVHEYAHVVDRIDPTSYQFSNSLVWRTLYAASKLTSGKSGFVSPYASKNRQEDFAETVANYFTSNGNAAKITDNVMGRQVIQRKFDYLKIKGIVK